MYIRHCHFDVFFIISVCSGIKYCPSALDSAGIRVPALNIHKFTMFRWSSDPITVTTRSKAGTIFACSNTGIVGSNPTQGMDVCVRLSCVCVGLCVGSGIATGWSPVQEVLSTVYRIKVSHFHSARRVSAANAVCRPTYISKNSGLSVRNLIWSFSFFVFNCFCCFLFVLYCIVLLLLFAIVLCNWPLAVELSTQINKELNWIIIVSWDSSLGMETGYGLDVRCSIPGRARYVSLLHSFQTTSGHQRPSYTTGMGGVFLEVKMAGAWS
jgi:hypothetical protein